MLVRDLNEFQSTAHPRAGRNQSAAAGAGCPVVSIHGPPEGRPKRRQPRLTTGRLRFQSTAHPRAGRNVVPVALKVRFRLFQSTAHPRAGRNGNRFQPVYAASVFQSTAHPRAGRNEIGPVWHGIATVSIHGPPEGRPKRHAGHAGQSEPSGFNPRPTRGQAETPQGAVPPRSPGCFNPRPTRGQAETAEGTGVSKISFVSIHGPPEGRPKRASRARRRSSGKFQSTAHPRAGRNPDRAGAARRGQQSFNPRPTRGQAETATVDSAGDFPQRFQSTAHPRAGRNAPGSTSSGQGRGFNPRPTRGQAETATRSRSTWLARRFNPRPTRGQAET